MRLLTAVNLMLPKLGEHPVTSLDDKHPTLAIILPEVENELITTLLRGWWFNQFSITLYPDTEKFIFLGTDTLSFVADYMETAVRGSQLFNPVTMDYAWEESVQGTIVQHVEFDSLPESVAQYIWYSALVNVYVTDLGMAQDVQVWQAKAVAASMQMLAEHLRHKKYSTSRTRRFFNLRAAMRT